MTTTTRSNKPKPPTMGTLEEITLRMKCIIDDAKAILEHIENVDNDTKALGDETHHGITITTHYENIRQAINFTTQEPLNWTPWSNNKENYEVLPEKP
jgi:hypothetical protein